VGSAIRRCRCEPRHARPSTHCRPIARGEVERVIVIPRFVVIPAEAGIQHRRGNGHDTGTLMRQELDPRLRGDDGGGGWRRGRSAASVTVIGTDSRSHDSASKAPSPTSADTRPMAEPAPIASGHRQGCRAGRRCSRWLIAASRGPRRRSASARAARRRHRRCALLVNRRETGGACAATGRRRSRARRSRSRRAAPR